MVLEVTDDSGFLALVVPATYQTFVSSDWTWEQILAHLRAQMARRALLIWGTGLEGCWKVDVLRQPAKVEGFRQVSGPLRVTGGSVLMTNYESLTMAAQFEDITLPEKHQRHLLLAVPDDNYTCRVIQMFDPQHQESAEDGGPDFVVELLPAARDGAAWQDIPWFDG
jgi:hypothetical protein